MGDAEVAGGAAASVAGRKAERKVGAGVAGRRAEQLAAGAEAAVSGASPCAGRQVWDLAAGVADVYRR